MRIQRVCAICIISLSFLSAIGCLEDFTDDVHVCETCLPCQTCLLDDDGPYCYAEERVYRQCGSYGDVHWFDACDQEGELDTKCVNGECAENSGDPFCDCASNWSGESCDNCPGNWDPNQDCAMCMGNWDIYSDCEACSSHWVDDNDDCGTCPGHWDPNKDCNECENHWVDEDNNCGTCPGNWDPSKDCDGCVGHFDPDENCEECIGFDEPDVIMCGNGIVQGDEECDDCNNDHWDGCNFCRIREIMVDPQTDDFGGLQTVRTDMASDGGFAVLWNTQESAYVRQLDSLGYPVSETFKVISMDNEGPEIVVSAIGHTEEKTIVAWKDTDIFARQYGLDGQPLGDAFIVNTSSTGVSYGPKLKMLSDDGFAIVWGNDRLLARLYGADGLPLDDEFEIEDVSPYMFVAIDTLGRFLIVWGGESIVARLYDADGIPEGDAFQVNTSVPLGFLIPNGARSVGAGFVIAWSESDTVAQWCNNFGRLYDSSGTPVTDEFQVNVNPIGIGRGLAVAMGEDGRLVFAWPNETDFQVRTYAASGIPEGNELIVSSYDLDSLMIFSGLAVAMEEDGRFVVAWGRSGFKTTSDADIFTEIVFAQRFDAHGHPLGSLPWDYYQ